MTQYFLSVYKCLEEKNLIILHSTSTVILLLAVTPLLGRGAQNSRLGTRFRQYFRKVPYYKIRDDQNSRKYFLFTILKSWIAGCIFVASGAKPRGLTDSSLAPVASFDHCSLV